MSIRAIMLCIAALALFSVPAFASPTTSYLPDGQAPAYEPPRARPHPRSRALCLLLTPPKTAPYAQWAAAFDAAAHLKAALGQSAVRYGESEGGGVEAAALAGMPGTLVMTVIGFICVAVARGRGWAWIAATAAALGEAGVELLPRIAESLAGRRSPERRPAPGLTVGSASCWARTETVETSFVGLLRRLGAEPAEGACIILSRIDEFISAAGREYAFVTADSVFPGKSR